ncbi:3-deoxy-D-manno-octulosonic acid kinase [Litorilituus sediminis]|uniref:3-deoxy-D-manno-octulosonic acid kinase n=1 Tax=Litorilituus sediminis TaxID=718192 RepID=A0A4P6P9F5_9GAMM|nr:3-deoxy-D-manno-octulosonic acid kinase [Litorilituus sediminis]QBG36165.1 3-deoxy-D-manno-octulosonic acid kinase [Litorilituus sediminis]
MMPSASTYFTQGNITCQYDENLIADFSADMLSADYWQQRDSITGSAQGRGTTWFIRYVAPQAQGVEHNWVLRHYYRGGLIGKLIKDSYLFTGIENTRAAKEYALLEHMQTLNLPAPKPVACRVTRTGLFYQADLLSTRIENAQDLVAILSKQTLNEALWQQIGATIKRFHDNGIYHHDLNAHNILLNDKARVFIIDFDRGEQRPVQATWQQANMARLKRSFEKELNQLEQFHYNEQNWQQLLHGYQEK